MTYNIQCVRRYDHVLPVCGDNRLFLSCLFVRKSALEAVVICHNPSVISYMCCTNPSLTIDQIVRQKYRFSPYKILFFYAHLFSDFSGGIQWRLVATVIIYLILLRMCMP